MSHTSPIRAHTSDFKVKDVQTYVRAAKTQSVTSGRARNRNSFPPLLTLKRLALQGVEIPQK